MSLVEDCPIPFAGVRDALDRLLRPAAVGFSEPCEVLKDPWLDAAEKRAILSSWASDASSVEGRPDLRWLLGTERPVPLADVRAAIARLDAISRAGEKAKPPDRRGLF